MLLNPNAGARQGRRVWQRVAPLFKAANIRVTVRETKRPSHAHVMAAGLTAEQLRTIDGAYGAGPAWLAAAGDVGVLRSAMHSAVASSDRALLSR